MSKGLGRGLSSLIPPKVKKVATAEGEAVVEITAAADKDKIINIPPAAIRPNSQQPRQKITEESLAGLVESIKEYGIIQPLIVSRQKDGYELIAGERRWRAAKIAGLKTVPVIVRRVNEQKKLELALIENIQRQDLNPIETALAYRKLIDEFNLTQNQLAQRLGKARPSVANTLRLLNLPEPIQQAVAAGQISEGHAKILAGLKPESKQMIFFKRILQTGMNVDQTNKEARRLRSGLPAKAKLSAADQEKQRLLEQFFGTKVEIKRRRAGGQVIINFFSDEELGGIISKIKIWKNLSTCITIPIILF